MNKDARIYVAGHRGLVGSAIIRRLERDGYTNILTRTHGELDLTRQDKIEAFFEQECPEYVFLAAAKVGGIMANSTYPADFIYQNLMIAANVIHSSYQSGVQKLLNLGSSCIYPKLASQPLKEDCLLTDALEPTNEAYAIAKIAAIKLCRYYNEQYGTNYISVMPTNLYGLNDNFNLETSHVLPALIRKMHLGQCLQEGNWKSIRIDLNKMPIEGVNGNVSEQEILSILYKYGIQTELSSDGSNLLSVTVSIWGTGLPRREFLHADDLADACVFLMSGYDVNRIGEFVNVGVGEDLTIRELVETVAGVIGFRGQLEYDETKPDGTPQKLMDVSRLRGLGWSGLRPLREGIQTTVEWYQNMLENCQ